MTGLFAPTHGLPSWRKAGKDEGFRITGQRGRHWDVRRLSRNKGEVRVPKAGWVRFRWSRDVPADARSFRVTRDPAGRWHVAFAVIPDPVQGPGTGEAVGIDRGVTVSAALSTGEMLTVPGLTAREQARMRGLQRRLARARRGSARRGKARTAVARLKARETDPRESQARFRCTACGYACNADVNAARNIAAGHAVKARGGDGISRPVNREPQLLASLGA